MKLEEMRKLVNSSNAHIDVDYIVDTFKRLSVLYPEGILVDSFPLLDKRIEEVCDQQRIPVIKFDYSYFAIAGTYNQLVYYVDSCRSKEDE